MTAIGIDISKDYFDAFLQDSSKRFPNTGAGIQRFIKVLPADAQCVMESTGPYSYRLAEALFHSKVHVSVVNALSIKRFGQMNLKRTKTDAMDARLITDFAKTATLRPFVPLTDQKNALKLEISALETLKTTRQSLLNVIHAQSHMPRSSSVAIESLKNTVHQVELEISVLKKSIKEGTKKAYGQLAANLHSIPGFGRETIPLLLVLSNGFEDFEFSKQIVAFAGLCPGTRQSGTSVRGRGTICRSGHGELRSKLYMCALSAYKGNKACKALYDRLLAKGKPKKVALVAVAHKLLKQAYGIAKSGLPYDEKIGMAA